jgi:hypothetical protein
MDRTNGLTKTGNGKLRGRIKLTLIRHRVMAL